ncbi:solute carrier family 22 member 21-like isoform X2 [Coccinella septempunctata]|uniref:solute carrier family 22 member 21-like isoform X2 n=1 Tax=Coccinella septempunctata TaxID=41139 RepID=UPI001D06A45A|nr:solute carrier family 22 member 21-like isoform X2 [Coccinella septempunctata]
MTASDDILDDILLQMGGIGKQQVIILFCLASIIVLHSATHIAYVFTSMDSDHRCLIPECEDEITANSDLLRHLLPFNHHNKPVKCLMYSKVMDNATFGNCSSSAFNESLTVQCSTFHFYDEDFYLAREFDLLCDDKKWALSLVGTTNTVGMFLGLTITGFISDKFGRKRLLLIGMSACGIVGLVKTLSPSFRWFLLFELTEAIFSAGTCGCVFIMGVELVVPQKRALVGTILNTCYTIGEILIAVIAWWCKSWRTMIYLSYGPCSFLILLYWILPESLRWMLSKGKIEQSKKALRSMALLNARHLPEDTLNKLERATSIVPTSVHFSDIMKSSRLFWRFVNCCFGWITCAFLFYGITLNSVSLYGNKYLDFILISLTELPAYWSCNFLVNTLGRRTSICASYFITFAACVSFIFTPQTSSGIYLFIYCLGKFGATAAFYIIYVITSESFPTPFRHSVMGLCSTVGRFGSMTSPQIPLLGQFWGPLPMILFAIMSGLAGLLSLFLPETNGIKLPDTIQEAEKIK